MAKTSGNTRVANSGSGRRTQTNVLPSPREASKAISGFSLPTSTYLDSPRRIDIGSNYSINVTFQRGDGKYSGHLTAEASLTSPSGETISSFKQRYHADGSHMGETHIYGNRLSRGYKTSNDSFKKKMNSLVETYYSNHVK